MTSSDHTISTLRKSCLVLGILWGGAATGTLVDVHSSFPYMALRVLLAAVLAKRLVLALAGDSIRTSAPKEEEDQEWRNDILDLVDSQFSNGCLVGALITLLAACRNGGLAMGPPQLVLAAVEFYGMYCSNFNPQQLKNDGSSNSIPQNCGLLGVLWGLLLPLGGTGRVQGLIYLSPAVVLFWLDSLLTSVADHFSEEQRGSKLKKTPAGLFFCVGSLGGCVAQWLWALLEAGDFVPPNLLGALALAFTATLSCVAFHQRCRGPQQSPPAESVEEEEEGLTEKLVRVV